jgi:hypothetical protein
MKIVLLFFLCFATQSLALKFGLIIDDESGFFTNHFVAFGQFHKNISQSEKHLVIENLKDFCQHYMKNKSLKSTNATDLEIKAHFLEESTTLPNGLEKVALGGELSTFMAEFHVTIKNTLNYPKVWDSAKFYSHPLIVMDEKVLNHMASNEILMTIRDVSFEDGNFGKSQVDHTFPKLANFTDLFENENQNECQFSTDGSGDDKSETESLHTILILDSPMSSLDTNSIQSNPKFSKRNKHPIKCSNYCNVM